MIDFLKRFWRKIESDRVFFKASALSYTFVLSLIPLSTLVFSLYSRFGQFERFQKDINALLLKLFMPQYVTRIQSLVNSLIHKSSSLGIIGIIGVVIFSVLLLETVDDSLHEIWRVKRKAPRYIKYLSYWAFITLSPLFIVLSLYISSQVKESTMGREILASIIFTSFFKVALPWILTSLAFFILYYVFPSFPFSVKNALIAALLAGFLWELSKYLFDYYIEHFSLIPYIYGAIGVLPMFLIWIYFSWLIALLGAELVHILEGFCEVQNEDALYLSIMLVLLKNYVVKGATTIGELSKTLKVKKPVIIYSLEKLYERSLLTFLQDGKSVIPTVSPEKLRLKDLLKELGLVRFTNTQNKNLEKIIKPVLKAMDTPSLNVTIKELLNYEQ